MMNITEFDKQISVLLLPSKGFLWLRSLMLEQTRHTINGPVILSNPKELFLDGGRINSGMISCVNISY